jgi:Mat/Ecp fimbriae major subunit
LLKTMRKLSLGAIAPLALLAAPAAAQQATAAATATVEIDDALLLENTRDLQFGTIAVGATGGTVTINPSNDAASSVGSVTLYGPLRHRAEFVSRAPLGTVMVMLLDPSVTLTHSGGVATMNASLTRANGPGLITATVLGLPICIRATSADQYIYVGGSLTVGSGQLEGVYSGQFNLTVNHL